VALALRAGILFVGLALAVLITQIGMARHLERSDPARAALAAPYDARAAVETARTAMQTGADARAPDVRAMVARALARDATLTSAIELRALDVDPVRAAKLFELSAAISRRSLPTRLWLIQRAVDRGDVASALGDFDTALRTSTAAPDILFPVLAGATDDPALVGPIAALLDQPEDWRVAFLNYAAGDGHAAAGAAAVALRMKDHAVIARSGVDDTLVASLVDEGRYPLALQLHDAYRPAPRDKGLVRDPDFADPAQTFPFGWSFTQTGALDASRISLAGRPALSYRSLADGSGQAALQLLLLPPGGYHLAVRTAGPASDPAALPVWSLTCAQGAGGQLGAVDQPAGAAGVADLAFDVPADCPAQWLRLALRPAQAGESSGAIASVRVTASGR
jgi:hypothetical protein